MLNDQPEKWNALLTEWERQNAQLAEFESTLNDCAIPTLQVPTEVLDAFTDACAPSPASSRCAPPFTGLRA